MPLPSDWIALVQRTQANGVLTNLHASWNDADPAATSLNLRAEFARLGFALDGSSDGGHGDPWQFSNLSGSVSLDQDSGYLRLASSDATLRLPPVWGSTERRFDTLETQLRWARSGVAPQVRTTELRIDAARAANDDVDVHASGSARWTDGAALDVDLSGNVARGNVPRFVTYLPASLSADTAAWLRDGLLSGSMSRGTFSLKGDPRRFPFADPATGDFQASVAIAGGEIDPAPNASAPAWPHLTDIQAQLRFDRDRLLINASHAKAYNYDLSDVEVQLPHLETASPHLLVRGKGAGSLGEVLRYAGSSPVNGWTGNWMADARGAGSSTLTLRLDIPLNHAIDSVVAGQIGVRDATLIALPDLPPFAGLNGQVNFSEKGVQFDRLSASSFLGGGVTVSGRTRADGAVILSGTGIATPAGVQPLVHVDAVRQLLAQMRGQTPYQASIRLQGKTFDLQADSPMLGLASNLPQPLRKAPGEARQLHVDITPDEGASGAGTVRVRWGNALDVLLRRSLDAQGHEQVERGAIALGHTAVSPDSGLELTVDEPELDGDAWLAVLLPPGDRPGPRRQQVAATTNPDDDSSDLRRIDIRARNLVLMDRPFKNAVISAHRDGAGPWQAQVDADSVSGTVSWDTRDAQGHGKATGRFSKLILAESGRTGGDRAAPGAPARDYPDLDIVAEQFALGRRNIGHLELTAQSVGDPAEHAWQVQKLRVSNPDGTINGTGSWRPDQGSGLRRVALDLDVHAVNLGNLLDRLGWPGYIRNGQASISGRLSWLGEPSAPDFATLAGDVRLEAQSGTVMKLNAGAGRLLAVFSLQSFWSLVTGDLRDLSAGVGFDSVNADATISRGVLSTENFLMKGNTGAGRIKGSVDLDHETQNLDVIVVPEVSAAGASLAYAAFINPAIGLSALIGGFILNKPLGALLTREYHVSGNWSDPKITPRGQHDAAGAGKK